MQPGSPGCSVRDSDGKYIAQPKAMHVSVPNNDTTVVDVIMCTVANQLLDSIKFSYPGNKTMITPSLALTYLL